MSIYESVPKNFESVVQGLRRKGENARISKPVMVDGNKYCGVIYKPFWSGEISGVIFIDEGGSVAEGYILQGLLEIFYYYNLFFDTTIVNLSSALKSDSWLRKEESDYLEASRMLIILSDQGIEGALEVKDVVDKLPSMKTEENDDLKLLLNKVKEYEGQKVIFSRDIMDELIPIYEKAVLMNFQTVKFINTASKYYYDLKRELSSRRGIMKNIFNKGRQGSTINLESSLAFFQNVLGYYGDTLNLSDEEYIDSVRKNHSDNIRKWLGKMR